MAYIRKANQTAVKDCGFRRPAPVVKRLEGEKREHKGKL